MRTDTFYLVRSDLCYTDGPEGFRPKPKLGAEQIAIQEATRARKPFGVYEVRLVGIAEPPSATYKPIRQPRKPRKAKRRTANSNSLARITDTVRAK